VVPRHLPYHAGFSYFQLDQQHPDWSRLAMGTQLAIHIAGEFPGLELQLWAIRG
jgi:type VI secretion system protein ImpJ